MSQPQQGHAPRHPSIDRQSFVAAPGYRGAERIGGLDRTIVGSIAKPLAQVELDREVVQRATKAQLGVALLGQAWLNQLPDGHPGRSRGFLALPYAYQPGELNPNTRWIEGRARTYAESFVDVQITKGGTLITTPSHVLEQDGPGGGRENELQLARLAASEFRARTASLPPLDGTGRRDLFAMLAVKGRNVLSSAEWLVGQYADLDVAGYWITVAGFTPSERQMCGLARLAFGLQDRTNRPVVVSGVGGVHLVFLAAGLAATSVGHQALLLTYPPAPLPPLDKDTDKGLGTPVYHPRMLGSVRLGPKGEPARRRLFIRWPCACGHHPANEPPGTQTAIRAHNDYVAMAEARTFCTTDVAQAEARILERIDAADESRAKLGVKSRVTAWKAVIAVARDVRAGRPLEVAGGS